MKTAEELASEFVGLLHSKIIYPSSIAELRQFEQHFINILNSWKDEIEFEAKKEIIEYLK